MIMTWFCHAIKMFAVHAQWFASSVFLISPYDEIGSLLGRRLEENLPVMTIENSPKHMDLSRDFYIIHLSTVVFASRISLCLVTYHNLLFIHLVYTFYLCLFESCWHLLLAISTSSVLCETQQDPCTTKTSKKIF